MKTVVGSALIGAGLSIIGIHWFAPGTWTLDPIGAAINALAVTIWCVVAEF